MGNGLKWNKTHGFKGDPYHSTDWERRTVDLKNFRQEDIEVPTSWSQNALQIAATKYFRGHLGTSDREDSVRKLIDRVVKKIEGWAIAGEYFVSGRDTTAFISDLTMLLLHQKAAFNSPVWFNLGWDERRQAASACYILSVEDSMSSIFDLAKTEGMLFKDGSGCGSNLSVLRSSRERLTSGGTASGPVSFMRGYDSFAGVIKSAGATRRAAKMVILDVDHPDILEFIRCKAYEERKAWALIDGGFDGSFNGESYASISFQNANNSVRVTDDFMQRALKGHDWTTRLVTVDEDGDTYRAMDLIDEIAQATYVCGDPGMQFHDTINRWHTCPVSGPIRASNPCSEYMFLDDTACNLASINLGKFVNPDRTFDVEGFRGAVRTMITAQEIIVGNAQYPTERIEKNSHDFRPLGLGYSNLGTLLMVCGIPYDSDKGRYIASMITSVMTGEAYRQSAVISRDCGGPFKGYNRNKAAFLKVMRQHKRANDETLLPPMDERLKPLHDAGKSVWKEVIDLGASFGFRNAQATVLAPTGTIGLMMDCDTTGVEPDTALVKEKHLVGGGTMQIINTSVKTSLLGIGYTESESLAIQDHLEKHGTIEGAPGLQDKHLPIFDCAHPANGERFISIDGHIRMVGAVQPFLSGAVSKTINVPEDATVRQIRDAYILAWELGLKSVSIYRDNCKRTQPIQTRKKTDNAPPPEGERKKLSDTRKSVTHKFEINGHKGYITVGLYDDGSPGELFLIMSKSGSTISGLMDAFAVGISFSLQRGVTLRELVDKFVHTRFEPAGYTKNKQIPMVSSIVDYVFRWMALEFLSEQEQADVGIATDVKPNPVAGGDLCATCGSLMIRSGTCFTCTACGATSGCG